MNTVNMTDPRGRAFIVTDGCMWEMNKKNGKSTVHAIEVVDAETGQLRYIKSGSRISFLGGDITNSHNQEDYNSQAPLDYGKKKEEKKKGLC